MDDVYAGFVDAGFLKAEGAKVLNKRPNQVQFDARQVVKWLQDLHAPHVTSYTVTSRLLRIYWYDGEYSPSHPSYKGLRSFHDAIADVPGIQLRLGQMVERPSRLKVPIYKALTNTAYGLSIDPQTLIAEFEKNWLFYPTVQQKGVDTLIALDMVRLAGRGAFGLAVLVSGDRDLAEVVRTVQDYGISVIVVTPNRRSVAGDVLQIADGIVEIPSGELKRMLPDRPSPN